MVIPTDVQVAFIAAAWLADLNADSILGAAAGSDAKLAGLRRQFALRAVAYPGLFVGPGATLFLLGWPSWEFQYWGDQFERTAGQPLNAGLYALFLVAMMAAAWFGNWLAFRWIVAGARTRLRGVCIGILVFTTIVLAVRWPAPVRLGSFAAFRAAPIELPYIWDVPAFFWTFLAVLVYTALPLVVWAARSRAVRDVPSGSRIAAMVEPGG